MTASLNAQRMYCALRQAGQLHRTGSVTHVAFKPWITADYCRAPRSWRQQRTHVAAATVKSMGVLHGDIETVLYNQDAIAGVVSKLGKYVSVTSIDTMTP